LSSVKELENQVADLENEASRLSRALDSIKATSSDLEASSTKKVEELSKDLANEVSDVYGGLASGLTIPTEVSSVTSQAEASVI
jgi:archaellum component FlaC